jgi:hypothetical protein
MWSKLARVAAAAAFALLPALVPSTGTAAAMTGSGESAPAVLGPAAQGQDVCPEPNDSFQDACYLGPGSDALGFIRNPNDTDAYRIEVLDFNTDVHVEMPTMPAAYKIELANWNGDIIASSSRVGGGEVIDTTVDLPGVYYVFVHSEAGGSSATQPYNIFRSLTYPGASIPDRIVAADFRQGAGVSAEGETETAIHKEDGGKYTIQMKVAGEPNNPEPPESWWTGLNPELTDFTLTVDTRVVNNVQAGISVFFRHQDDRNTYQVGVDSASGAVQLWKIQNGEVTGTGWKSSAAIDTSGGVNRIVIRAFEDNIRVNVNGEDLIDVDDGTFRQGRYGIGAIAYGPPPIVSFDNLIITTPTEG